MLLPALEFCRDFFTTILYFALVPVIGSILQLWHIAIVLCFLHLLIYLLKDEEPDTTTSL